MKTTLFLILSSLLIGITSCQKEDNENIKEAIAVVESNIDFDLLLKRLEFQAIDNFLA